MTDPTHCARCGQVNPPNSAFCTSCGVRLDVPPQPSAQLSLEAELRAMREALARMEGRLVALERLQGIQPPVPASQADSVVPAPGAPQSMREPTTPPSSPPLPESIPQAAAPQLATPPRGGDGGTGGPARPWFPTLSVDWERALGLNWLAIVGALALAVGVGFFLKLAFDNNWVGPTGRVVIGGVGGLALLGLGELTRRRYPLWAQAVTGGGVAILYLSIYATFGFFRLLDPLAGFALLSLLVAVGAILALRYGSLALALLGIAGAFLNPVLLAEHVTPGNRIVFIIYLNLVDVGILAVSTFRNWRWFTLVGLLASYGLFGLWTRDIAAADALIAQAGVTGVFIIFVGATTLFHIIWRRVALPQDLALMALNALSYFGATYGLLWEDYSGWFGLITLSLALFYGLVGHAASRRPGAPPEVSLYSLATAVVFLTMAVPLQLGGSWITVAWAAEGAALVWAGLRMRSWQARAFGLGVLAIAGLRLLVLDTGLPAADFSLLLNPRFPTFAFSAAVFFVAAHLYRRASGRVRDWEKNLHWGLTGVGHLLVLWMLSAEAVSYFDSRAVASAGASQDATTGTLLSLTALWSVYSAGLLLGATRWPSPFLRFGGLTLLGTTAAKYLLLDTAEARIDPGSYLPLANFHFLAMSLVLVAGLAAVVVYRRSDTLPPVERGILLFLAVGINVFAVWGLSAEVDRAFDAREETSGLSLASARHLSLTTLWALYAVGIVLVGMVRRSSRIRLAGLCLLGVPVLKLFSFDVFLLERGYRVAAFIGLGVLLLGTGLVYQRYNRTLRGFLFGART